jgi:hypothetical protein
MKHILFIILAFFIYGFDYDYSNIKKSTVIIMDNNCSESYSDWRKQNTEYITKTYVDNGILFHLFKSDEIIIVLTPKNALDFIKSYSFPKNTFGKFLFFGEKSIDLMFGGILQFHVEKIFGSNYKFLVPNEGCNKSFYESETGC